jgi:hypothetical protein
MDEAAGPDGEFYGFSKTERDRKLKRLCAILNKVAPTEISNSLDLDGFYNSWGKAPRPLCEPYFFQFLITNASVAFQVGEMGSREPYEIFFDENQIFGPRAKAWYPIIRAFQDKPVRALMPVEPYFRSDTDTLPLQAADLTAWIKRKSGNKDGLGEFAWVKGELSGIAHSVLSKHFDEKFIRNKFMTPPGDVDEVKANREAALRAYSETFGHEWPPKNKKERKKMRGR